MKLIFEKSAPGRKCSILPKCDVETVELPKELRREVKPALPEMSETDISRPLYRAEPPGTRRELRLLSSGLLHHEI